MMRKQPDGSWLVERASGERKTFENKKRAENWLARDKFLVPQAEVDTLLTHAQIAEMMGISRSRVQQIEQRALYKLRALLLDTAEGLEWSRQQN
jgi:DNA-directed RNA polymerase sigma subunit (sigma70/sigma32)